MDTREETKPTYKVTSLQAGETVMSEDEIIQTAISIMTKRARVKGELFSGSDFAKDFFKLRIGASEREVFCVAYLDTKHRLIECDDLFKGTIDRGAVYPRELVKRSLELNAAAVVLAHNHPSGITEPSHADEEITRRIVNACGLVDIRVLDHVIVSAGDYGYSLGENGLGGLG